MNFNWIKTHWLTKKLFSNYVWDIPNTENKVFLTFDDGPIPEVTEWVLDQLKKYNVKATFFCIGENIKKNPDVFLKLLSEGHSIGNHTFNHLNGWKTETKNYIENIAMAEKSLQIADSRLHTTQNSATKSDNLNPTLFNLKSKLFRPPYGKIKLSQSKILREKGYKIIMWDIISYDFDAKISKEQCLENVLKNVKSGSIIVFHDSKKAFQNLEYVLPRVLENLSKRKFVFEKID
jgi:peptidoglycan/xylan/chitin deacetylase (PgdA/CDA1 family)